MGDYLMRTKKSRNWQVRLAVPRPLWSVIGRREFVQSTGTADRKLAERLKHTILADFQRQIEAATHVDPSSPVWLEKQALALRRAVQRGELDSELASDIISDLKDRHLKAAGNPADAAFHPTNQVERVQRATRLVGDLNYKPLSEIVKAYIEERSSSVNTSTVGAMERALGAFQKWLPGDPSVDEVGRLEAGQFVSQVLLKNGRSPKTNKDTLSYLSAFWNWCIRRGHTEKANPWAGMARDLTGSKRGTVKQGQRRPWTPAEIAKIDDLPATDVRHQFMKIAMYSGLRLNEIAHLQNRDVDLKAGMLVVREGKTAASVRQVPIHPAIRPVLKKLRGNGKWLFEGLEEGGEDAKRGHSISKRIGRWVRENVSPEPGVVFHALRNSFMHQCERAGIPESTTKLLVGHARQSLTYGLYSNNPGFDVLVAAMKKVAYEKK